MFFVSTLAWRPFLSDVDLSFVHAENKTFELTFLTLISSSFKSSFSVYNDFKTSNLSTGNFLTGNGRQSRAEIDRN